MPSCVAKPLAMTDTANETGRGEAAGLQRGSLVGATLATAVDLAATVHGRQPSLSLRGQTALSYAERGWHVFPILEGKKRPPRVEWTTEATCDKATIRRWWSKWPNANIGIACGPSKLCVIDLDVEDQGNSGEIELRALIGQHGDLPPTRAAATPSGGAHLYFAGNTASSIKKIGKHIDVKSVGGYVVAPGSDAGGRYEWEVEADVAPLPERSLANRAKRRAR
jgi:Bifunctional DNA primase/polymerase, N-terminal